MAEKVRVVIMLRGGNWIHAFFPSRKLAQSFIKTWHDQALEAMSNERVITTVLKFSDDCEDWSEANFGGAAIADGILAMYIANDRKPSAADRIADVVEKQANSGEEWRES